ncbi:MAG: HAMP domain-containing histidine kinase [Clostridium sp.]|nr:HAMP domain-containing histidine kinase [Clostridium sp.]
MITLRSNTIVVIIVVLSTICFLLLTYILKLKREIRGISSQIKSFKDDEKEKMVSISIFDKDIEILASEINEYFEVYKIAKHNNKVFENKIRDLISNISHDLRTPLTIIMGNIKLIKQKEIEPIEGIQAIERKAEFMKDMVNDLFELIFAIDKEIELEPINIVPIVQEEILSFYEQVKMKNIDMNVLIDGEVLILEGEKSSFKRIIQNLISNSLKYGEDYIKVKVFKENDIVKLIVSNKCPNVTLKDINLIFDRFYMIDKETSNTGTGLGLAIVKSLVTRLKGDIRAEYVSDELSIICEWKLKDK